MSFASREAITSSVTPTAGAQWFPSIAAKTIGRGLFAQILRDCEITREDIQKEI